MIRLPIFCFVPALLAAATTAHAQTPADSVVRTTTVTTITTTTVTKPAAPGSKPTAPPVTSSTTSSTTTSVPAAPTVSTPPVAAPKPVAVPKTTATAKPVPAAKPKTAAPAATVSRTTTTATTAARRAAAADPDLVHFLQTDVDLTLVRADQLPNLYERFMETTRAERRQWNTAQWATAGSVLSRLNQRYEQVRGELSLEEKLNIRTLQGEFRGLEAAKTVSKRL